MKVQDSSISAEEMVRRDATAMGMGPRGFKSKMRSLKNQLGSQQTAAEEEEHAIHIQPVRDGAIKPNISSVSKTDTVIVGNGPSALALSYLLHGNEPWYNSSEPHPDSVLHRKLLRKVGATPGAENVEDIRLYDVLQQPSDYADLTRHFHAASSMSYSTAALPLNTMLDTLLRPLADIDLEESKTRINWRKSEFDVVPHVILGEEPKAGGQWAGDEVWFGDKEDEDSDNGLKTLSYADFLSLPGYSMGAHYKLRYGKEMHPYYRPSRRLVADYYAEYPHQVGIEDVLYPGTCVTNIERINDRSGFNFLISIKINPKSNNQPALAHVIRCRNVVLATGIFSHRLPPPPVYAPFFESRSKSDMSMRGMEFVADDEKSAGLPLLVVGSGYTAADAILCNQGKRQIIHVYRWQPEERPSPLRGCHPTAYPGYAGVYRHMKEAARKKEPLDNQYEGFPNATVIETNSDGFVKILVKSGDGKEHIVERKVADIKICIGRRGRLDYLAPALCQEIGIKNLEYDRMDCPKRDQKLALARTTTSRKYSKSHRPALHPTTSHTAGKVWVQHSSLRGRVENNIEVTPNVFIVGSLTGDSLVRFAMGGCVYSAGRIIGNNSPIPESSASSGASSEASLSESEEAVGDVKQKLERRHSRCAIA